MFARSGGFATVEPEPLAQRYQRANWFDHHCNVIRLEDDTVAVFDHELNHFLLHVATPYGLFLDLLTDIQTRLVVDYARAMMEEFPERPIRAPIHDHARARPRRWLRSDPEDRIIQRQVRPWTHAILLERVLEGRDFPSVRAARAEEAYADLLEMERIIEDVLAREKIFVPGLGIYQRKPPKGRKGQPACPTLKWGKTYDGPAGAHHVMEGIAQQVEVDTSGMQIRGPHLGVYWSLWMAVAQSMPRTRFEASDGSGLKVARDTFHSLAELALFAPIGPFYRRFRSPDTRWGELHPAYRFLRALACTVELEAWVEDPDRIDQYQALVCISLGWRTPEQYLEDGASNDVPGLHWERHREACRLRLEHGLRFYASEDHSHPAVRDFLALYPPIVYLPNQAAPRLGPDAGGMLMKAYVTQWAWQVMAIGVPRCSDLIPPNVDYAQLFSSTATEEAFIEMLIGGRKWLDPVRYE